MAYVPLVDDGIGAAPGAEATGEEGEAEGKAGGVDSWVWSLASPEDGDWAGMAGGRTGRCDGDGERGLGAVWAAGGALYRNVTWRRRRVWLFKQVKRVVFKDCVLLAHCRKIQHATSGCLPIPRPHRVVSNCSAGVCGPHACIH